MDPQVQEMQQLLQIYIRRLNEETSKSIAFEARIVQLINQINAMQPQGPHDFNLRNTGSYPVASTTNLAE